MKKSIPAVRCFCMILFCLNTVYAQHPFIQSASTSGGACVIKTDKGKWRFSCYVNGIIKTTFTPSGSDKNEQISDAVIANENIVPPVLKQNGQEAEISWPEKISIRLNTNGILYTKKGTCEINLLKSFYSAEQRGLTFSLQPDEMIFGTGERSLPMNRRGYKLSLNNNPWYGYSLNADALNFSVPFILSSKNYAIFFDNPSKGYLDIGKSNPDQLEYAAISGAMSFYIIPGNDYNEILSNYHLLVGTQPLPPRWAMGNFMSRFGYTDEQQTRSILTAMKKDSVPFDAVIFDLFWFGDSIKNTMGNLAWVNKKRWPDPKKMISDFRKEHIKTILITEPFVLKSSLNYEASKKFHAIDSAGNPFVLTDFYFGLGGLIDIFRKDAQQWMFGKYKEQMNNGVSGWWGDLGEPEKHPAGIFHELKDLGFNRKFAADEVHNIYGHYWSKSLYYNFMKAYPNKRLFHLNRSGYAGSPRYSCFPWSGDVSRSWDGLKAQLPLMQGMSISGIPYIHSDAGGFAGGEGDAELYVRWLQFAAFTPIYRPHGTALGSIEPAAKDIPSEAALWPEPTKSLAKKTAATRYSWLPYNYNLCYRQSRYSKPLVSPLFFLNQQDSNLYKADEQYLWGENVMVVPILEKNQSVKKYYIPAGSWTNINDLRVLSGPQWYSDSSITLNDIPLYAKEGSFIPQAAPMMHTDEYANKLLTINYYPSEKPSSYELYEDDGETAGAILYNQYEITTFKSSGLKNNLTITVESNGGIYNGQKQQRKLLINIPNLSAVKEISVNGKKLSVESLSNKSISGYSIPLIFEHKKLTVLIKR